MPSTVGCYRSLLAGGTLLLAGPAALAQVPANEAEKIVTADADTNDRAGFALSMSGQRTAVGARWDGEAGYQAGAAYIYSRNGATWYEHAKLLADDAASQDEFGYSISISADRIVAGARGDDDNGSKSGSAYVFALAGGWSQQAKLTAADATAGDEFGFASSISGDVVAVGAPFNDEGGLNSGAVYVFRYAGGSWSQEAKLLAPDAFLNDNFGRTVVVSGDTLMVGAPYANHGVSSGGAVYVYEFDGAAWNYTQTLEASDRASNDNFGRSLAFNGPYALIGAPADDDGATNAGAAYLFSNSGGTWSEESKLTAPAATAYDEFGDAVALWGNTAVVSCPYDDEGGTNSGSAFLYYHDGSDWQLQVHLMASDAAATDGFGRAVAIGKPGVAIGAPFDDDGGPSSGAAYLFAGLDDCDENGVVDLADASQQQLLPDWDSCCPGDVDGDGRVVLTDLAIFLAMYGVWTPTPMGADLDGNGWVGLEDLQLVLQHFGMRCD